MARSENDEVMIDKMRPQKKKKEGNIFKRHIGVIYAICASFCLSLSMLAGKKVKQLGGPEISFLRSCIMSGLVFPFVSCKRYKLFNYKGFRKLLFTRAVCLTVGSVALYSAILLVPLPDATAVKYCSVAITPLFATQLLKERVSTLQIIIIIICMFGIACIANPFQIFDKFEKEIMPSLKAINHSAPNLSLFQNNSLYFNETATPPQYNYNLTRTHKSTAAGVTLAFVTSICEALAYCLTRKLSCGGIPASVILLNLSTYSSLLSIPICVIYRVAKSTLPVLRPADFGFAAISGSAALFGHGLMVKALHREHTGLISVIRSMDIVFSFIYQFSFFNVQPTRMTYIGATLIVCSIITISVFKMKQQNHHSSSITTVQSTEANEFCAFHKIANLQTQRYICISS
ncbi:hypothetical protein GJ496_009355 [Pomphorhynchus laevis]|nr:hypothetical protein GJ496_009355 [Pomphorhynchus laevis]